MRYGSGQRCNPHTLRVWVIKNWNSKWYDEEVQNLDVLVGDVESYRYLKQKLNSNISISNFSLFERKIELERLLGKSRYKKLVNKVKMLSR